jgi:succinate dehydrogenase/fumarate reductase flavoprotein subunit
MSERTVDVLVAGSGAAGCAAAIGAHDAGAEVLVVEKAPRPGGLSAMCSGFLRVTRDRTAAAQYLEATSGGRIDGLLIDTMAEWMAQLPDVLRSFAAGVDAEVSVRFDHDQGQHETADLYDWEGRDALGWAGIESIPGFDGYDWISPSKGHNLMRVLHHQVEARGVQMLMSTPLVELIVEGEQITGAVIDNDGHRETVHVRGGVVLATGGFEWSTRLLQDHLEIPDITPIGHRWNTGDGVDLAQQVGAATWHMWHLHGSYGFRPPGRIAMRNHLGGTRRSERSVAWIVVDQYGRRFMNEAPPAPQDTPYRDLGWLDPETGRFPRIPCWTIFDESGRQLGPIGRAAWSDPADEYHWSADNLTEIGAGWIKQAGCLSDLAEMIDVPGDALAATIEQWNRVVEDGDDSFGRPSGTMEPIRTAPYYAIETWPIVTNTQGGPRHDHLQRVLTPGGEPIAGLWCAGELGSIFGHIYLLGGNLTEAVMGGGCAGRNAAATVSTLPTIIDEAPRGIA